MARSLLIVALLAGALPSPEARAADATAQAEIVRLLEVGWESGAAARAAADQHFQSLAKTGPTNPRANYAYALVLMKQRRYDEALQQLDRVLKADSTHWAARENKVRLLMLTRSYAAALVEINRLSQTLADAPQDQVPPERHEETLRFVGRMFGFLEGPAGRDVTPPARQRVDRDVSRRLSEQEQAWVEEAREGVLARYAAMTGESERGREAALATAERQREEDRRDLEERRAEQKDRRAELAEHREKLRQEVRDLEAAFAKEERPLLDRLAALERQAAVPRRELSLLLTDIDRLRVLAAETHDPIERDRLLFRAQQLDLVAARYDADLALLERQAAAVNTERAALKNRFGREIAVAGRSVQAVDRELDALQRGEKRNAIDERRLERPLTSGTRRVRAIEAEAAAFTTYEALPLEEERRRVLDAGKE